MNCKKNILVKYVSRFDLSMYQSINCINKISPKVKFDVIQALVF